MLLNKINKIYRFQMLPATQGENKAAPILFYPHPMFQAGTNTSGTIQPPKSSIHYSNRFIHT